MINFDYGISLGDIPSQAREWRNLPEIRNWCRENDWIHQLQQNKWLMRVQEDEKNRMYGIWAHNFKTQQERIDASIKHGTEYIESLPSIVPVGVAGMTNISWYHRTGEWSLYVAPEYQGKGYATMALKTLVRHGFEALNLNRIWGEIFENNVPCIKLAEKLGFVVEGHLHDTYYKNGKYIGSVIVGLLRKDWKV